MDKLIHNIVFIAVFNTVLDGLVVIDTQGTVVTLNYSATRMFGYEREDVIGQNITMLMPEPYRSEHGNYINNYLDTGNPKVIGIGREVKGKRKNGEVFPMELGVGEMIIDDKLLFVGTIRDISERKKAEKDIATYIQKLKRSNQELDDFAYIASHDLKEPLRGLSNNALFLKEDWGDKFEPDAIKRLDRIMFLAERLEKLANDLLHFSRLGKQEFAIQKCSIEKIAHDAISLVDEWANDENIDIKVQKNMPEVVCDKVKMREVLHNLISNAIKYNDKPKKKIEIGCNDKGEFFVKDNGKGIPKHFQKDVFRIFKRLNNEKDDVKGTGVGLTFVKKIIERHNGAIWIHSDVGKRTTFFFTLPGGHND